MKRFSFLLGVGVGFVLGSKAGSRPYEHLEATIRKVASRSGPHSDDEGHHQFVDVVRGGVDKGGNVVVDEVVAEVDSEGRVVATDETIVVETPEGDIVVDETFSVADDEGGLRPIEEDVTVLEAGDTKE